MSVINDARFGVGPGFEWGAQHRASAVPVTACHGMEAALQKLLSGVPGLEIAFLFGSLARGLGRADSDIDLAVRLDHPLSAAERMDLIDAVSQAVERPVDLVDLRTAGEPTVGQVMRHGRRIWGSDQAHGALLYRHLVDQEDFGPLQRRILEERRRAWIGK
jgi:predicted nucleotidyltransferase